MSKYYEPIRQTVELYLDMLEDCPLETRKSTAAYMRSFLHNTLLKIEAGVNDYQLNREISYATRVMIELGCTSVGGSRKWYKEHFWPLDGEDYTESTNIEPVDE